MEQEKLIRCWWECKVIQSLWKTVRQFLKKLNVILPYDPAITLLCIYSTVLKISVHTKTCTWVFIVTLFIFTKNWKQPRCPLGKWRNKLWYNQTMECHSMIKKKWVIKTQKYMDEPYVLIAKWKEASLKRLHNVWFQLYDVLEKAKL